MKQSGLKFYKKTMNTEKKLLNKLLVKLYPNLNHPKKFQLQFKLFWKLTCHYIWSICWRKLFLKTPIFQVILNCKIYWSKQPSKLIQPELSDILTKSIIMNLTLSVNNVSKTIYSKKLSLSTPKKTWNLTLCKF